MTLGCVLFNCFCFFFFLKSRFQIKILPRAPECHVGASVSFSFSVAGTLHQGSQSIPQRPCRISTHCHFVGEEAEVLSFMGGPPGSSRPIVGLACPPCTSTPLATQNGQAQEGQLLPLSLLQRPGPCLHPQHTGLCLCKCCSLGLEAPLRRAHRFWLLASLSRLTALLLWAQTLAPTKDLGLLGSAGARLCPSLGCPRLPLQSGWPGVFRVPLSGPSRLPSTWPPGDSRLLTRKTAPGLVTR